jgi:RNA polymerase sigma factor (sigma-70 family)
MARASANEFLRCLTRGLAAETLADQSDRQLVERALARRDEAALEAIVRRHGPMVYRVCWRNLEHPEDAEDAFQAAFLVLARRLIGLRKHTSLASWLHGVAQRVALKAKARAAARRRREQQAARTAARLADSVTWGELRSALDYELTQLPDKWRQPLILCYLEGRTQDEAAAQLKWSKSTLRRRLAEARPALARRLSGRGIVLPAAFSGVLLSDCLASAAPAPGLVASTVEAAAGVVAGNTIAAATSAKVVALAEGVLKTMSLSAIKWRAALLLLVGVIASGAVGLNLRLLAAGEPKEPVVKKETKPPEGVDDAKLLQGVWRIVDGEKNGKGIDEDLSATPITVKGDELTFFGSKCKFKLDTGKSPREIYLTLLDGKSKGESIRAIYSLEKDEIKFCWPLGSESARATEFKTKPRDGLLLLVLRRGAAEGAGVKNPDDIKQIKRDWVRPDAPPDGNYKLTFVDGVSECTCVLIKLATKDGKQAAGLVNAGEDWRISSVHSEVSKAPAPAAEKQASPGSVPVRIVCTMPRGDGVFEGRFAPGSLVARGYLQLPWNEAVFPASLSATDLPKLKFTMRELPAGPLKKGLRFGRSIAALRQNAEWTKDATEKARLLEQAARTEKEASTEVLKLYREGIANVDDPLIFDAVVDAARSAGKYRIPADQLRGMIAKAENTAANYGRPWQRELDLQITDGLAPQKEYTSLAADLAVQLEKNLEPDDGARVRSRVLKTLIAVRDNTGTLGASRETLDRLLAKEEAILDREYRAKVPPFKPDKFAGRKGKSDRAVVLELFTGTQCPPCIAASVAFDALHETYNPGELVLLQYHLHIPGPDQLTNADGEARWAFYAKAFPKEIGGVPTTLFNGKPKASGGGGMADSEEKYKQYRQAIDPLLETDSVAKLSASAVKGDNKINIQVDVTDLKNPGGNIRLRLLLVEETVRFPGRNMVRFHRNVVRSTVGGTEGFALKEKESKHAATVDLDVLRKSLNGYLDNFNNQRPFPNSDRPLDLANLHLIALVQDDQTHEILQAVQVDVVEPGKTAAKQ